MSKKEIMLEKLKKLQELQDQEQALRESRVEEDAKYRKNIKDIEQKKVELFNYLKKQPGVVSVTRNNKDGDSVEYLYLFGDREDSTYYAVMWCVDGKYYEISDNFIPEEYDELKERCLANKIARRAKIVSKTVNEIHSIDCKIDDMNKDIKIIDNEITEKRKGILSFIFKGKLEKLEKEKENLLNQRKELEKQKSELEEKKQAYEDVVLVNVNDSYINQQLELAKKISHTNKELKEERENVVSKSNNVDFKTKDSLSDNKKAQGEVLMSLLYDEQILDELESYVESQDADKELVEVAKKVLKAAGRGSIKVIL